MHIKILFDLWPSLIASAVIVSVLLCNQCNFCIGEKVSLEMSPGRCFAGVCCVCSLFSFLRGKALCVNTESHIAQFYFSGQNLTGDRTPFVSEALTQVSIEMCVQPNATKEALRCWNISREE